MNKQEENWELMTVLQIPWSETVKITDEEDRAFLLGKAAEIKAMMIKQQQQQQSGLVTSLG
jgi:hypothetical protein